MYLKFKFAIQNTIYTYKDNLKLIHTVNSLQNDKF